MKIRTDYVTNSSSSSFILAFKDKKDAYAAICEAFLNSYRKEGCLHETRDDEDEYYRRSFDEYACVLDNIILAMAESQISVQEAIDFYIEETAWWPVRCDIRDEIWNDEENYPRENAEDFKAKYDSLIDERKEEKLKEIRKEMEEWLKDKTYISKVNFEDHWPESQAYEICEKIDKENMKMIRE